MTRFTLAAAAALLIAAPALAQDETAMKLEDAPAAALDAAKARAEGIEFTSVNMDRDGGTETYEFAGKDSEGRNVEVDVLADGTVEEVEYEINEADVPAAAMDAVKEKFGNFVPAMIERSERPEGKTVYEFEGKLDGEEVDIEVDADGANLMKNGDMES